MDNDRRKKNRVCVLRFWRSFGEVPKPFSAAQTVSSKAVGVLHEPVEEHGLGMRKVLEFIGVQCD